MKKYKDQLLKFCEEQLWDNSSQQMLSSGLVDKAAGKQPTRPSVN